MDRSKTQLIESVFAGLGEMGARMRAVDWAATALGPVEQWPQSLRICVRVVLGSGYPMGVYWGPHYTVLYNDAFRQLIGTKHPAALGRGFREVFPELWDFLGSVRVESMLGQGSTFTVTIPSGEAHLPAERVQAAQSFTSTKIRAEAYVEEAQQWSGGESGAGLDVAMLGRPPLPTSLPEPKRLEKRELIILADDNADMRRYLMRMLGDRYEVHAVADGRQALEATRQLHPALVLTDVMMPELDGFGLLHAIRDDSALATTPVILLSARAGEESRVEGLEAAADDYLVKPFTAPELLARVATHVKMANLRREAAEREERLRSEAELERQKLHASMAERLRIARDLHDTLLQSFQASLLLLQAVSNKLAEGALKQELARAINTAAQGIAEGRDAIQGMRVPVVERNDLAESIRTLGEELVAADNRPQAVQFTVQVLGVTRELRPILHDEAYRIAGEALRNAFRHADAERIEVEIRFDERELRLRVRDDGNGIDPKLLSDHGRARHFGLRGMKERAKLAGGKLTVRSELETGTEVELSIPAASTPPLNAGGSSPRGFFFREIP